MNRRGFLSAILATATAPAIVRAESLMKIAVPEKKILVPNQDLIWPIAGWNYEPGQIDYQDWYMGPFGMRFDRAVIPPPLVGYIVKR
jgi:hypothetical protein